jgi:hypothetical protein
MPRGRSRRPLRSDATDPAQPHRGRKPRLWIVATLALFTVVFTSMRVASYVRKSATWDEPIHLTSGYAALAHGDYRFDPAHPPLARMWAALPLLAMDVKFDSAVIDLTPPRRWLLERDAYEFAQRFLYRDNDGDRLLYAARFMIVLFGIAAGYVLFFWTYEWLGFRPAIWGLGFYLVSPNLTAHASLVTTDMPETCLLFASVYFLWRLCRQWSRMNLVGLAACCSLAVVTKFSGLVLGPVIGVLLGVAVWRARLTWRQAAVVVLALSASTVFAIWAVYGFQNAPSHNPAWRFELSQPGGDHFLRSAVDWVDAHHLLPNAFVQGFLYCAVSSVQSSYLLGSYSQSGWWYYFPVAFAVKTPVSHLLLLIAGLAMLVRHWRSLASLDVLCILIPAAAYAASAIASGVNIGIRHMLPVYPFSLMLAVAAAGRCLTSRFRGVRWGLAASVICWAASYASVYPNSLTFFNVIAGGPDRGLTYLADSNLDWGQHLKSLKQWMDRRGISHVNLAYFGQADPAYYGINATLLPGTTGPVAKPRLPGYVAISATVLSGVYLPPGGRLLYQPFRALAPVARIGHTINVYWIDQWPEMAAGSAGAAAERELADSLLGLGWLRHSVIHYRRYLRVTPGDAQARANFGLALLGAGSVPEALDALRDAVRQSPDDARIRRTLGAALLDFGTPDEARVHVLYAVGRFPNDAMSRCIYGRLLAADGRWPEAISEFERAVALDPLLAAARDYLSQAQAIVARRDAG